MKVVIITFELDSSLSFCLSRLSGSISNKMSRYKADLLVSVLSFCCVSVQKQAEGEKKNNTY